MFQCRLDKANGYQFSVVLTLGELILISFPSITESSFGMPNSSICNSLLKFIRQLTV